MKPDKRTEVPEEDKPRTVVARREVVRRQSRCPQCGRGRMPDSRYCVSCGAMLPEIQRAESPEAVEQRSWHGRVLSWLAGVVPGVISLRVATCSLALLGASCVGAALALRLMSRVGGGVSGGMAGAFGEAMFGMCLYALVGFFSIAAYVLALIWLLDGGLCGPLEAVAVLAGLRAEQWAVLCALVVLGVALALWLGVQ